MYICRCIRTKMTRTNSDVHERVSDGSISRYALLLCYDVCVTCRRGVKPRCVCFRRNAHDDAMCSMRMRSAGQERFRTLTSAYYVSLQTRTHLQSELYGSVYNSAQCKAAKICTQSRND